MGLWRLKWVVCQLGAFKEYAAIVASPARFYWQMAATLFRKRSRPIRLELRPGGSIRVWDFMNFYVYREVFVDRCYDVKLDRSDPVILDVGANTGLFSLRMKQLYPQAKITCFEPFPPNFAELQATIQENNLQGVTPVQAAVGAKAESTKMYINARNLGGHSLFAELADSANAVDVDVLPIVAIVESLGSSVDLMKLDCEGAEYAILKSLTQEIASRIQRIIIEPTPQLYDIEELKIHMRSLGYSVTWRDGLYLFATER